MANISSIGIGSGVLTSDLIDQLSEAERAPTELRLDRKEAEVEAKLSAVGRINSALIDLRLPSRVLSNPDALNSLEAILLLPMLPSRLIVLRLQVNIL